jgi:hypothetical protein
MRTAPVLLTAFPLALLATIAAERSALMALGAFPDNAITWMLWLNLHSGFGRTWQAFETVIGGPASAHLIGLAIVALVVVSAASSRRWPSYVFLTNHAAFILAVVFSLIGTQAKVSSLGAGFLSSDHWALIWATEISTFQVLMLVVGLTSCLACHAAVLQHLKRRGAQVAIRIKCLQKNF